MAVCGDSSCAHADVLAGLYHRVAAAFQEYGDLLSGSRAVLCPPPLRRGVDRLRSSRAVLCPAAASAMGVSLEEFQDGIVSRRRFSGVVSLEVFCPASVGDECRRDFS